MGDSGAWCWVMATPPKTPPEIKRAKFDLKEKIRGMTTVPSAIVAPIRPWYPCRVWVRKVGEALGYKLSIRTEGAAYYIFRVG
jgi:hypothetical protein